MKICAVAAVLALLICRAFAGDSSSVILGKTLAAVEHARQAHAEAVRCGGKRVGKHELLNWDRVEGEIRDLAGAKTEPRVTRMLGIVQVLPFVRDALLEDLVVCTLAPGQSRTTASIEGSMSSVDDATTDLQSNILGRVTTLEWTAEQYRKSSCSQ